jgi:hypothetical protein
VFTIACQAIGIYSDAPVGKALLTKEEFIEYMYDFAVRSSHELLFRFASTTQIKERDAKILGYGINFPSLERFESYEIFVRAERERG